MFKSYRFVKDTHLEVLFDDIDIIHFCGIDMRCYKNSSDVMWKISENLEIMRNMEYNGNKFDNVI